MELQLDNGATREGGPSSSGMGSSDSATANKVNLIRSSSPQAAKETDMEPMILNPERPLIPPQLQYDFDYIKTSLTTNFSEHPPHTIQRLAELVLTPRSHYCFLSKYLNALDKAVSVSSGSDIFPLPNNELPMFDGKIAKPASDTTPMGVRLSPIPWLSDEETETTDAMAAAFDTVNGAELAMASSESMRSHGMTIEGEMLGHEQETNDSLAPVASLPGRMSGQSVAGQANDESWDGEDHETPHARGPDAIGMEDMGPQKHAVGGGQTLDMEAAVGRTTQSGSMEEPSAIEEVHETQSSPPEHPSKDEDGDLTLADVETASNDDTNTANSPAIVTADESIQ